MNSTSSEYVASINSPSRPAKLPYPATEDNLEKLEQYLKDAFQNIAFNQLGPFPKIAAPHVHIHLKPDAIPYARHSPIPVPYHWKTQVKVALDRDIERGIITSVPVGTPVT